MKIYHYSACLASLALFLCFSSVKSQTKAVLFEGTIVAGYVDQGGYINCIGPSVKLNQKSYALFAGLLPSLRIKEDKVAASATKNTDLTPGLGFGLTAIFRHIAVQLPFYYNPKTSTANGKWNPGVGLGYKF